MYCIKLCRYLISGVPIVDLFVVIKYDEFSPNTEDILPN